MAARQEGGQSWRGGPALFVHDANLLVDTTEDVVPLLNRAAIERVDHIFLTHWHPDHTAGFRVVEQVNGDNRVHLLDASLRESFHTSCTQVWMNAATAARLAGDWRFYERNGVCRLNVVEPGTRLDLGGLKATWFAYGQDGFLSGFLSGFLLEDDHARVLLILDEAKDLAALVGGDPALQGCDLLVAQCGFFERDPYGRLLVGKGSPLWANEPEFERDTLPLITAARVRRTILTHLSDIHGRTPAEFDTLAATLAPLEVQFAYDGLRLEP